MKWKGRKQSKNIEFAPKRKPEAVMAEQALYNKTVNSGRALDPEPIETTRHKTPLEETTAIKRNPARTLKAKQRPLENNPPDFEFFKHTIKEK